MKTTSKTALTAQQKQIIADIKTEFLRTNEELATTEQPAIDPLIALIEQSEADMRAQHIAMANAHPKYVAEISTELRKMASEIQPMCDRYGYTLTITETDNIQNRAENCHFYITIKFNGYKTESHFPDESKSYNFEPRYVYTPIQPWRRKFLCSSENGNSRKWGDFVNELINIAIKHQAIIRSQNEA